ncbi:RNA polymerase I-specific transcription initiation factor RRN3 [Patellaria atrata CBS 101060]|uniref:RNA polymerase I-specific transcription initiation factor RRN3 n=1 Tax=Patellaria atrata CBS 101060 TaxID=1346257 RepID=A0A9P4S586_9PEZI|nr:RNA polymerase I-specific transcription initiation factor RRN3 [Patellaria atrata CBS 101060]
MVSIAAAPGAFSSDIPNHHLASKRKFAGEDVHDDFLPSSLAKRHKVAFAPDVQIRIMDDYNNKPEILIREEVRRGIDNHILGDSAGYDQLKHLFTAEPGTEEAPSTPLLQKYVSALINHISMLKKNCSSLVHAILDCDWLGRDERFVALYTRLLESLLSAHGGYATSVLEMVVTNFVDLPPSTGQLPGNVPVNKSELQARAHRVLKSLLTRIPSASSSLAPILSATFPFSTDSTRAHIEYTQNLLFLTTYTPELKGQILALIIEKLVKIDVQIQVDMEDLEDELEENLVGDIVEGHGRFHEEDEEGDLSEVESDTPSRGSVADEEERLNHLKQSIVKLDTIMDLLFNYYHPIFSKGTQSESIEAFEHLQLQFSSTILPTYRSRHTQFLLFHFGQSSPVLIERFVGSCAKLSFDKNQPHFLRLSAAAYLASFIARGAHVSRTVVNDVFDVLGNHLDNLRRTHEPSCVGPDLQRYGAYYALAQALLYIFCFRWRDLVISEEYDDEDDEDILLEGRDLSWARGIKDLLTRNIYSRLNPLKICSPAIVTQFARFAHHLRFMYVFPLIETNKRIRFSRSVMSSARISGMGERETSLSTKRGDDAFQLDAYFPFDPYSLPRSRRWLSSDYIEWKSIPGLDDSKNNEDIDEDDDDDDDDEDDDDDSDSPTSVDDSESDDDDNAEDGMLLAHFDRTSTDTEGSP